MMRDRSHSLAASLDEPPESVLPRRRFESSTEMDITPMIDITFLLLIFFVVASIPDPQSAPELPAARNGIGVGTKSSVVITVAAGGLDHASVYLADGKLAEARLNLPADQQRQRIREAVQRGLYEGRPNVLIKAEKDVAHRDVTRVAEAVSEIVGVKLHFAVLEDD